ncbi:hypothetical protein VPH35_093590 [Triticum aestivum]
MRLDPPFPDTRGSPPWLGFRLPPNSGWFSPLRHLPNPDAPLCLLDGLVLLDKLRFSLDLHDARRAPMATADLETVAGCCCCRWSRPSPTSPHGCSLLHTCMMDGHVLAKLVGALL